MKVSKLGTSPATLGHSLDMATESWAVEPEIPASTVPEHGGLTKDLSGGTALWPVVADINVEAREGRLKAVIGYLSELILALIHAAEIRQANVEMVERRHPADSRRAVQWVERFEAHYRVWTPVYALAADLEAALQVYTHEPADHLARDPDSAEPYDPDMQAREYARSALSWYARYQLELRRFMVSHRGLWLPSDSDAEQDIADAIYRVGGHNDLHDGDDSWLRRHIADSRHEEVDRFTAVVLAFPRGVGFHEQWQRFVRQGVDTPEANVMARRSGR